MTDFYKYIAFFKLVFLPSEPRKFFHDLRDYLEQNEDLLNSLKDKKRFSIEDTIAHTEL